MSLIYRVDVKVGEPEVRFSLFGFKICSIPVAVKYTQKIEYQGKNIQLPINEQNVNESFITRNPERCRAFYTDYMRKLFTDSYKDPNVTVSVGYA